MTLRPARVEDAEAICAISNQIIRDTLITFTTQEKTATGLAADITARGPAFLVAELSGQVAGFATYAPFRGGPGYAHTKEHSIQLAPWARGQGTGAALMQALEAVARAERVHSLLAGVSSANPDGVAFHARLGFKHVARLPEVGFKNGQWLDLVLMQKFLSPTTG